MFTFMHGLNIMLFGGSGRNPLLLKLGLFPIAFSKSL